MNYPPTSKLYNKLKRLLRYKTNKYQGKSVRFEHFSTEEETTICVKVLCNKCSKTLFQEEYISKRINRYHLQNLVIIHLLWKIFRISSSKYTKLHIQTPIFITRIVRNGKFYCDVI